MVCLNRYILWLRELPYTLHFYTVSITPLSPETAGSFGDIFAEINDRVFIGLVH